MNKVAEIKARIATEIAELEVKVAEAPVYTPAEFTAAEEAFEVALSSGECDRQEIREVMRVLAVSQNREQLARLKQTLVQDLMECPKYYVVSNEKRLVSPAGVDPSERVFVQTTIAIHTDNLNRIPNSNVQLYGHKIG